MNLDINFNSKTWYSRSWQFETNSIQIQLQDLAVQALAVECVSSSKKKSPANSSSECFFILLFSPISWVTICIVFFSCLVFFFEDWCDQDVLTTHIYIGAMNIPMLLVDCMLQPSGSQMLL